MSKTERQRDILGRDQHSEIQTGDRKVEVMGVLVSHHEGAHHDVGHLGQLIMQQGGCGVVSYLATPKPIRKWRLSKVVFSGECR